VIGHESGNKDEVEHIRILGNNFGLAFEGDGEGLKEEASRSAASK